MKNSSLQPQIVLGVCAHPDDLEFVAGGSIANWVKAGAKVYYLICSDGSKGPRSKTAKDSDTRGANLTKARRQEQVAAAKMMGVEKVFFLNYEDSAMQLTQELKRDICRVICQVRPDTVVTIDPSFLYSARASYVNHPDHRVVGEATLDAVYPLARDGLTIAGLLAEDLEPHKTKTLLLTRFDGCNYFEDINITFSTKLAALGAHQSQFATLTKIEQFLRTQAADAGKLAKCRLAEGFVRIDLPA